MTGRKRTWLAAALTAGAMLTTASAARAADAQPAAQLGVGDSTFWEHPVIAQSGGPGVNTLSQVHSDVVCNLELARCLDYDLRVDAGGRRLRVAIDWPSHYDHFRIELRDPSGGVAGSSIGPYSAETFVDRPAAGRWLVRVIPIDVTDSPVRMRAKLEGPPPAPGPVRDQVPNVRLAPPYEFSLNGPNGNCQDSERQQYEAQRCLRFSTGPANVGEGPLDLRLRPSSPVSLTGTTYQRIRRSNGSYRERAAGPYEFHFEHLHYHHQGVAGFDLLRVDDPATGSMTHVGGSPKLGFCMGDYFIAEWEAFGNEQARGLTEIGNACGLAGLGIPGAPITGADIGLATGWGDVYTHDTEGNFVEFSRSGGDGLYVVRGLTDPPSDAHPIGTILESDEDDNAAYSYIAVQGSCVRVLERGRGLSPWDPDKVIANDTRQGLIDGQCVAPSP